MQHKEVHKLKKGIFEPLYKMVEEMEGSEIKINDFWDSFDFTANFKNKFTFVADFKKYAPKNLIFRCIQKKGTFVKYSINDKCNTFELNEVYEMNEIYELNGTENN